MIDERSYFLRQTCYHEAAHLVVFQHFGGIGYIRIKERENPLPDETSFAGYTALALNPLNSDSLKLVGLAGVIAECLMDDPDVEAIDVFDFLVGGVIALSPTDAELVGEYGEDHIEATLALLRELWPQVKALAEFEEAEA